MGWTGWRKVEAHSRIGTDNPTRKKRMPTTVRMTVLDGMTIGKRYPRMQEPMRLQTGESRLTFRDVENNFRAV